MEYDSEDTEVKQINIEEEASESLCGTSCSQMFGGEVEEERKKNENNTNQYLISIPITIVNKKYTRGCFCFNICFIVKESIFLNSIYKDTIVSLLK